MKNQNKPTSKKSYKDYCLSTLDSYSKSPRKKADGSKCAGFLSLANIKAFSAISDQFPDFNGVEQ